MEKIPVNIGGIPVNVGRTPVSVEETPVDLKKYQAHGKIIDITVPISPFTRTFPGDPIPAIEKVCTLEKEGCNVSKLSFGSHTGTHVDAPSHILENGLTVDKLDLKNLMGTALILDFSSLTGTLTADILEKAYLSTGAPENTSILLLKTEISSRYQRDAGEAALFDVKSGS